MKITFIFTLILASCNFVIASGYSLEKDIAKGKAESYLIKNRPDNNNPESIYFYSVAKIFSHQPDEAVELLSSSFKPVSPKLEYVEEYHFPYSYDYDYCAGLVLHSQGKMDAALKHFKKFKGKLKDVYSIKQIDYFITQTKHKGVYMYNEDTTFVKNLGTKINSKYNDHSPLFWNDKLYFSSNRTNYLNMETNLDKTYAYDFKNEPELVFRSLAKTQHSPLSPIFSNDAMLIFVQDHKNEGNFYISQIGEMGFGKPVKTASPINSKYIELSASFNKTDSVFYFSSDRPEGIGGLDIYMSTLLPNGTWTAPENLGPEVNTPFNEDAPYFDIASHTLYFSSNSHLSLGSYDLFKSKLTEAGFETAVNLGYPINTTHDEIYMTKMNESFVFSSNRHSSLGGMDLYTFEPAQMHDSLYKWHITGFPDSIPNTISHSLCQEYSVKSTGQEDLKGNYFWIVNEKDTIMGETAEVCLDVDESAKIALMGYEKDISKSSLKNTFQLHNEPLDFFISDRHEDKILTNHQGVAFKLEKAYWKEKNNVYTDASIPKETLVTEAFFKISLDGDPYPYYVKVK